jgi:MYXO-CTERM domain-containing protein
MRISKTAFLGALAVGLLTGGSANADTRLEVGDPIVLSAGTGDKTLGADGAAKVKILRMGNGTLVAVYGDFAGTDVFDVKAQAERPARDIFVRTCNSNMSDCASGDEWSDAVNISQTAGLTSIATQWHGEGTAAEAFYGDSDKPNVFNNGSRVVLTWNDKYCPGGSQNTVTYLTLDLREVPYSCQYVAVSLDNGATWSAPQQLSDGSRDAKQDVNKGSDAAWVITWQEDPEGLQLGDAEGPGDGASGANVSNGTDIWYSALSSDNLNMGMPFPEPVRLTNNYTQDGMQQGSPTMLERGSEGASRANTALIGPNVIVAYEETKGTGGVDSGKYIRYHVFPYNSPPDSCEDDPNNPGNCMVGATGEVMPAVNDPARMGCIISDPDENARRVRFFAQGTPGEESSIRFFIFWKQGLFDQGGPSDILGRSGFVPEGEMGGIFGFRPQDLSPAIIAPTATTLGDTPDGCLIRGDEDMGTGAFGGDQGINLSASTPEGGDLGAGTSDIDIENALAHRGAIRGDFIMLGYSYTPDWAVATYTDQENYDFWVRTSMDGGVTWTDPVDLSSETMAAYAKEIDLPETGVNVREPRIVKTPGNGPGCPSGDPMADDTTNAEHCSAGGTYIIGWGSQTNTYEHLGGAEDLEIFLTRTTDRGMTFEPVQRLSMAEAEDLESQLRPTPDGRRVFAVWNEATEDGFDALFAPAIEVDDPTGGTTGGTTGTSGDTGDTEGDTEGDGSSGGGGDSSSGGGTSESDSDSGTTDGATTSPSGGSSGGGETDSDSGGTALDDDGGCSCTSDGGSGSGALGLFGLGLLGLMRRRRR